MGRPIVALLLAAVLALGAGCSGDTVAAPPVSPSVSPSATVSSSPSSDPKPESAEEFIRRWVRAGTAMQNSGRTAAYRRMVAPCVSCQGFADRVQSYYRAGGFIDTDGWVITSIAATDEGSRRSPVFILDVDSQPTQYRETASGSLKHLPGGPTSFRVTLERRPQYWLVSELFELPT
ncbi:hypothetical protein [Nocardioides sp.]|uniref:hypothetical protein n=1 Tax=Nocardioides sp. TaxID=35761 RepID=UPI002D1FAE7F|nr:hypothetical protein [Nocardioides sp.]